MNNAILKKRVKRDRIKTMLLRSLVKTIILFSCLDATAINSQTNEKKVFGVIMHVITIII